MSCVQPQLKNISIFCKAMPVYLGHNITNFYFQCHYSIIINTQQLCTWGGTALTPQLFRNWTLPPPHPLHPNSLTNCFLMYYLLPFIMPGCGVHVLKILKAFLFKSRCSSSHNAMTMKPIKLIMRLRN